ncbi:NUDIX hydrolase [Ornithinibacillus californiensis]|uniref:NUDIX hydrolase n=1 Tax=Ornithinibacillus californiensis TaxID=161536 RepID=UPI00064D898D|nr:NUDIX domain-containing protein [Ornithinibacillus californiensis]
MFIVNVEGAIYKEGKWLLIRRSEKEEHAGGSLSLVGGKCEIEGVSSDILERTLHREIYEEVGIKVTRVSYVNSSSFVTDLGDHVIDIVFLCHHQSGVPYPKSVNEVDEVLWFTTNEIASHTKLPVFLKKNIKLAAALLNELSN